VDWLHWANIIFSMSLIASTFQQAFMLTSAKQKSWTTTYTIAIHGVLWLPQCHSQYICLNDSFHLHELSIQPSMHKYGQGNIKINNPPNRDPKVLQKTPKYYPTVNPPICQRHTHLQCKFLNNCPPSAFHPYND
jgi:hypothetical protein